MGLWPIRELIEPAEVLEASEDVAAWGFARPVESDEIAYGTWFRMGKTVVFWFEAPYPQAPGAAFLHVCAAPRVRSRWPVRRWALAVEVIAELMGADYLISAPCDSATRDYALRLGWQEDGPRLVRMLGGVDYGRQGRGLHQPDLQQGCVEGPK